MNTLAQARIELRAKIGTAVSQVLATPPDPTEPAQLILVTAPGGLGKTYATADVLRDKRVVWHAPRNELFDELSGHLRVDPTKRVPALERRPAKTDPGLCLRYDERLKPLVDGGKSRFEGTLGCFGCPDRRKRCPYKRWRPSTPWIFAPHTWLRLPVMDPDIYANRDIVVVDESPLTTMLGTVAFTKEQIRDLSEKLRKSRFSAGTGLVRDVWCTLFDACVDLLSKPPPGRRRIELRKLALDLGIVFEPGTTLDRHPKLVLPGPLPTQFADLPAMVEEDFPSRVERQHPMRDQARYIIDAESMAFLNETVTLPGPLLEKLNALFDALAFDVRERPACVLRFPNDQHEGAVLGGHAPEPVIPKRLPIIVLDATGLPATYRRLLGERPVQEVNVEVQQSARIIQTTDYRYPASSLRPGSPAWKRILQIIDKHHAEHPNWRRAIILKKGLMSGSIEADVMQRFAEDDIKGFWDVRGINSFRDHDVVFVVGAPEAPRDTVEATARVFASLYPVQEEEPFDYQVITLKTGSTEDRGYQHFTTLVWWELHHHEFEQAVLRGRPFDGKLKEIFFISNHALNPMHFQIEEKAEWELLGMLPPLAVRAVRVARRKHAAGEVVTQQAVAEELGVSGSAISQALQSDPENSKIFQQLAGR